jgi:phosphoribosylformylglycinamidine cyclo-ligase
MFNTFNMGVGMCVTVAREDADRALSILGAAGEAAYAIGVIAKGEEKIVLC